MKILIIGMDLKYNAEYFYKRAFEKLGNEVFLINEYENITNPFITRILHTRTGLFKFTLENLPINKNLIPRIEKIDPNQVIIFKGELISSKNLKRISENYNLHLYYPDTYRFQPIQRGRLNFFKTVFTASNKPEFYYKLGAKRAVIIPWGCDPEFHRKINIKKEYDVSFIGSWYPNRGKILKKIKNIHIFGNFWYGWKNASSPVYGENFIETVNRTKINLNIHHPMDVKADAPNMRVFEISGCGAFQISDSVESIKQYFPSMPTFNTIKELKELIDYFLISKNQMDEIAIKNQQICYNKFKYIDSAKKILSYL